MKHPVLNSIFIVIISILLYIAYMVYSGISISLEAEQTLQSYLTCLEALTLYAEQNQGNWPESWEDLAEIKSNRYYTQYDWVSDPGKMRERVKVRFDLTGEQVAKMDSSTFDAVEQTYPNYGKYESKVETLIRTIRDQFEIQKNGELLKTIKKQMEKEPK